MQKLTKEQANWLFNEFAKKCTYEECGVESDRACDLLGKIITQCTEKEFPIFNMEWEDTSDMIDILSGMNAEDSRRIAPLVGSCFNDIYPEVMTWFSSQLSHRGTFTNLDQPMSPRIHNISTSLTSCLPGSSPLGDCNVY